jgi:hypothetical protein
MILWMESSYFKSLWTLAPTGVTKFWTSLQTHPSIKQQKVSLHFFLDIDS